MIFCGRECFELSGWGKKWKRFLEIYGGNLKKLKRRLRQERYRLSEKGRETRLREYDKLHEKRKKAKQNGSSPPEKTKPRRKIAGRCCKRAGCHEVFRITRQVREKRYCGRECFNAMRNVREMLKATYKETRCPNVCLVLAFIRLMKPVNMTKVEGAEANSPDLI
jgi:hypothetical protein